MQMQHQRDVVSEMRLLGSISHQVIENNNKKCQFKQELAYITSNKFT
jgi:hypothetical protein